MAPPQRTTPTRKGAAARQSKISAFFAPISLKRRLEETHVENVSSPSTPSPTTLNDSNTGGGTPQRHASTFFDASGDLENTPSVPAKRLVVPTVNDIEQQLKSRKEERNDIVNDTAEEAATMASHERSAACRGDASSSGHTSGESASTGPVAPIEIVDTTSLFCPEDGSQDSSSLKTDARSLSTEGGSAKHDRWAYRSAGSLCGQVEDSVETSDKVIQQRAKLRRILAEKKDDSSLGDIAGHDMNTNRKPAKYTPLESQFIKVKQENPDCLLMIEVGYKFRFFGRDAKVAAKELNIVAFLDHAMYTASVPTHRLMVYVKKLVKLGYKVGVVRQMETAALKASGDNKNTLFTRQLANIYTRSTLVDCLDDDGDGFTATGSGSGSTANSNYLLCLYTPDAKFLHNADNTRVPSFAIVAVELSTGDVIYDTFQDNPAGTELETRLSHIPFTEVLLSWDRKDAGEGSLSATNEEGATVDQVEEARRLEASGPFERVIGLYCERQNALDRNTIRVERKPEIFKSNMEEVRKEICVFYENNLERINSLDEDKNFNVEEIMRQLDELPSATLVCIHALIKYLEQFKLDLVMLPTKFKSFKSRSHMLLNSDTLQSLELFNNQTDGGTMGTLFSVMNRSKTKFGARMLRKWIAFPLVDARRIIDRHEAIREIVDGFPVNGTHISDSMKGVLAQLPDLERTLLKVFYGRCAPLELSGMLHALAKVAVIFEKCGYTEDDENMMNVSQKGDHVKSDILFKSVELLRRLSKELEPFHNKLNFKVAKTGELVGLFKDESEYPELVETRESIQKSEANLEECFADLRREFGSGPLGAYLDEYKSVSGEEYLVEVPVRLRSKVPPAWIKISTTKAVERYRTQKITSSLQELLCGRELLTLKSREAFKQFMHRIGQQFNFFHAVINSLAELDCLYSLCALSQGPGFVFPKYDINNELDNDHSSRSFINIKNGRNIIIESLLGVDKYVPNDIQLDYKQGRSLLLTGPNMGGKSSYIRQVALSIIMAQIGSAIPADSAELSLFDAVFTRMGTSDDIAKGQSTFMRELHETSRIMAEATSNSLVILDELGRGTSTHDGTAIAYASLVHFVKEIRAVTLFVTHYPVLGEVAKQLEYSDPENGDTMRPLRNCHMQFMKANGVNDDDDDDDDDGIEEQEKDDSLDEIIFLYKAVDGLAHKSYGLNVARLAGLPRGVILSARDAANGLRRLIEDRRTNQMKSQLDSFTQIYKM